MAPKKSLPLPPPSPEPKEEEELSEEGEEEEELDDEEEEEEESDVIKNEIATPISNNRKEEEEDEDDDEEEDEEEEDKEEPDSPSSPNVSDFTIKPITQKKRPSSSPSPSPSPSPSILKDDETASKSSKRMKTNKGEEENENDMDVSASGAAGRVWSLEDQIALLQGMIDYQRKTGADPCSDRDAFHKFIKKKLQAEISKNQMYDKVRRLKKRYEEKADSDDLAFPKPYNSQLFDLSKKIWGKMDEKIVNGNGNVKEIKEEDLVMDDASDEDDLVRDDNDEEDDLVREDNDEEDDLVRDDNDGEDGLDSGDMVDAERGSQSKYPSLFQSFKDGVQNICSAGVMNFVKENLDLIDSVEAGELEEKWNKLRMQETELYVNKLKLLKILMKEYGEELKKR